METRIGPLKESYSTRGIPSYSIELWHDGLKKHRFIKGSEPHVVRRKAEIQGAEWASQWAQMSSRDKERSHKENKKKLAAEKTTEAQANIESLSKILARTLSVNDAIDWDQLKDKSDFPEPRPQKPKALPPLKPAAIPREPTSDQPKYIPALTFLDKLIPSRREARLAECRAAFAADHSAWEAEVSRITAANGAAAKQYETTVDQKQKEYECAVGAWESRRAEFLEEQSSRNSAIDSKRAQYFAGSPDAILEYCDMVLSTSYYPHYFPQEFAFDYHADTRILVVDYSFPAPQDIPRIREVKYVATRDELVESLLTESQFDRLYDEILYQVSLRTIHELFEADVIDGIAVVSFNGYVTSIDPRTGKSVTACVLSLQVGKSEFVAVDLAHVEPKACFKALKGVGSAKLHSLTPIAPILQVRRDDGRFVSAREVANTLDETSNLATMDWEEFEHLIREVFALEFSSGGGEVKVTRTSRDGGVDAVAFDPDPIRGGKIVIQAKRYTNTVSVAAVRDLYGTVMNEGANKGILVTTSDYGPDAYSFANGKPLVLLNGANLLHLLEKHGHKVRIDLREIP